MVDQVIALKPRTPLQITLSVWHALLLRESLTRLFSSRGAWFWLMAEPVLHMSYLLFLYTVIRVKTVGGIDTAIWLVAGIQAFLLFRRTSIQVMNGVTANQPLFSYRQVKPIDTLLVRGGLEALLMLAVTTLLLMGLALLGHSTFPESPLLVFAAFAGLWLLGMGVGFMASVGNELVPELGRVIKFFMMPLGILSGVVIPITAVPQPYRDWLMLNPLVHGLEAVRSGFSSTYHSFPEMSLGYLYGWALVCTVLGLALQRRYALRMVTQ